MWRIIVYLLILTGFPVRVVLSQKPGGSNGPDKPLRIEIPAHSVNETYRVIPCGPNGIVVFFRSQEQAGDNQTNWYFTCYDTNLQQLWVKSVPLYTDQDYRLFKSDADTLALLFVQNWKSKKTGNSFEILRIAIMKGTFILNAGTLSDAAVVDAFDVVAGRAWLAVNTKGRPGKIMNIGLKHGNTNAFVLGEGSQITALWMQPDTTSAWVTAVVGRQISKRKSEYYLVRYDTSGIIMQEVPIGLRSPDRTITQIRVVLLHDGTTFLLGSYGEGETGSSQKKSLDESTGLFTCQIRNGKQQAISFYNFLELQSAGSIVGENDLINLQKKALRKQKPISDYSLDYAVLMHEISYQNDQYILAADFFSPQYHTESFTDFDFYGRPYTNSYSVFDGYRFYNTVVAGFDPSGKLLWDNNIEIRNLTSLELSVKTVTFSSGSNLVLCYVSDGKIGSKFIHENSVTEKLDFTGIDMMNPDDKLLTETKGAILHWYGNYFLTYGYQEIKNIAQETNNKRLVFYFTKLRFEK